jgi:hypothetical protein
VRAAFDAPLLVRKVYTGAADFGEAPGVVGSGWVTTQWRGNDATISSGGGGEKWEGGRWGGIFIGLGVCAHADHLPNPTSNRIADLSRVCCGLDTNLILGS